FQPVGVEVVGIVRPPYIVLSTCLVECVCLRNRAPMQRTDHTVPSIRVIVPKVASALRNINLAATGPVSIHARVGHHPDGRPQPRALWHFCNDLNLSVFDCLLALGGEASAAHWVDDGAGSLVATDGAHSNVGGCTCPGGGEVEGIPIVQLVNGDVCRLG